MAADARSSSKTKRTPGAAKAAPAPPLGLKGGIRLILEVLAIWLVVHTLFLAGYRIPSGSMEPTLQVGDFLFVTPLPYGPHIPFTNWNLPALGDPPRASVNVYESPVQHFLPDDSTPTVVKRIVAVPGDTIFMRKGVFFVNGMEQRIPVVPPPGTSSPDETSPYFDWQRKFELHGSRFGEPPAPIRHDDWGPMVVPAGHYFSLGDNRYNSIDARYYGFIPRRNFRGRPLIIYFSFDTQDLRIRWDRLLKLLWHA